MFLSLKFGKQTHNFCMLRERKHIYRPDALRLFKRPAPAGGRPLPGAGHDGERDGPPRGAGEFELLYPAVPPALWTNAQAVSAGAYFPQKMTQLLG